MVRPPPRPPPGQGRPVQPGQIKPGWVYSLTTTTGQGKGGRPGPPGVVACGCRSPRAWAARARAGSADDEPSYLAAQQGAFEVARCPRPGGGTLICTRQTTVATPIFWHNAPAGGWHYPYATVGGAGLANYSVSVDALLTQPGTSAGLIGRLRRRGGQPDIGHFDGYLFDVAASGAWALVRNDVTPGRAVTLAAGAAARAAGHRPLAPAVAGHVRAAALTAAVDGHRGRPRCPTRPGGPGWPGSRRAR